MDNHFDGLVGIDGQMLYVQYNRKRAERPVIVFLHDSLGCVALWRDFPKRLSEATQCNMLVYDRLGYGKSQPMTTDARPVNYMESEADILNGLLMHFGIDNAILFGHSDGGTIALLAANKYPCRIKSVICEAAHVFVEDVTLNGIYNAMEAYRQSDLPVRLQKYHGDKVNMLFNAWTKTWTRDDFRNWNIDRFLPGIHCPLLFIQGELDEFGTLRQVDKTVENVSGYTERYIIPGIGHTPHKDASDSVIAAATAFVLLPHAAQP